MSVSCVQRIFSRQNTALWKCVKAHLLETPERLREKIKGCKEHVECLRSFQKRNSREWQTRTCIAGPCALLQTGYTLELGVEWQPVLLADLRAVRMWPQLYISCERLGVSPCHQPQFPSVLKWAHWTSQEFCGDKMQWCLCGDLVHEASWKPRDQESFFPFIPSS